MSPRLLAAVLVVQTAILGLLALDRLVPPAHAADTSRCEITNWPSSLRGSAIPIELRGTPPTVGVAIKGWDTYDEVRVKQP
ncbi:MAG: hypothetical protein H6732_12075 [Alphaproteobacteria bacterium]|nr:hypothetical protein [Alphaproteobacteria bacterium]